MYILSLTPFLVVTCLCRRGEFSSGVMTLQMKLSFSTLPSGVLAARTSLSLWKALELAGLRGVRRSGPSMKAPSLLGPLGPPVWQMLLLLCSATLCAWSTALRAEFRIASVVSVCRRLFCRGLICTLRFDFKALVIRALFLRSGARVCRRLICIWPIAPANGVTIFCLFDPAVN